MPDQMRTLEVAYSPLWNENVYLHITSKWRPWRYFIYIHRLQCVFGLQINLKYGGIKVDKIH